MFLIKKAISLLKYCIFVVVFKCNKLFINMDWLYDIFFGQGIIHSCVIITLVSAIGIFFGKLKIFGISLGVSFVFFVGIVAGHFHMNIDPIVSEFVQSFGLSLFVFTLGMQVGPSFFTSLRSGGLFLNMLSMAVVGLGICMTLLISRFAEIPITEMIGVMSGAVTNTPALGAAQQALSQMPLDNSDQIYQMAYACAVTYPFGVIGAILVVAVLNSFFSKHLKNGAAAVEDGEDLQTKPYVVGVKVTNNFFDKKIIKNLQSLTASKIVVSRLLRDDEEIITLPNTEIRLNDLLLITVSAVNKQRIIDMLGIEKNIKWNELKSELVSRKIFVTKDEINGKTLESLQIRKHYNVNVTRVNRAGIFLLAENDLKLFVGDRVVIVGEASDVLRVEDLLGNAIKKMDEPHLFTIFTGIAVGLIVGSIPIAIPYISVPIKIGLAGGTIIVGILMGTFGHKFNFITYTTTSASLMLRELGIVLYLAALGISSGEGFVNSLITGNGLSWLLWGILITIVPIIIVGVIAIKFMKKDVPTILGVLCGSMANPPSLSLVTDMTGKSSPAVSYATVYPLSMFVRVVSAQILVMIFV